MKNRFVATGLVAAVLIAAAGYYYVGRNYYLDADREYSTQLTTPVGAQSDRTQDRRSAEGQKNSNSAMRTNSSVDFLEVKAAAFRGDADSQRLLSELYEKCYAYSLSPVIHMKTLDNLAMHQPDSAPYIRDMQERQTRFCSAIDDGAPIPIEAYQLWLEKAADGGDLAAMVRLKSRSLEILDPNEYQAIADSVVNGGDPTALFELGALLARAPSDSSLGKYQHLSGPHAGHAIEIVACRRGLACNAGSRLMDSICSSTGRCWYSSYENFVYAELVPKGGKKQVSEAIKYINTMLSSS